MAYGEPRHVFRVQIPLLHPTCNEQGARPIPDPHLRRHLLFVWCFLKYRTSMTAASTMYQNAPIMTNGATPTSCLSTPWKPNPYSLMNLDLV